MGPFRGVVRKYPNSRGRVRMGHNGEIGYPREVTRIGSQQSQLVVQTGGRYQEVQITDELVVLAQNGPVTTKQAADVFRDGEKRFVQKKRLDGLFGRFGIIRAIDAFVQFSQGNDADGQVRGAYTVERVGIGARSPQMPDNPTGIEQVRSTHRRTSGRVRSNRLS